MGALVGGWFSRRQAEVCYIDEGVAHVINSQAKVVQARAIGCQPCLQGVVGNQRLDELQLSIAQVKMSEQDGIIVDGFAI